MHLQKTKAEVAVWRSIIVASSPDKYCAPQLWHKFKKRASADRLRLYVLHFQAQEIKHLHSLCKLSPLTDRSLTHRLAALPTTDEISCSRGAIYVSKNCVYPVDWKKKNQDLVHSISRLLIYAMMLLLYAVTESLPFWWNLGISIFRSQQGWSQLQQL